MPPSSPVPPASPAALPTEDLPTVDLVGVGLNATDTLIQLDAFPQPGSKTEYASERLLPGGQVATAVVACQTWGLNTRYVGKLGEDDAARLHAREFARLGVDARLLHVPGADSPKSLILVDSLGERTVICRRDERVVLAPADLRREWIVPARALLIDGHDTAAAHQAAAWAAQAGIPVVADLDEPYPGVEALLACVDFLIVSRDLPQRLTGLASLPAALRSMRERFACRLTAATLGAGGVLAWDGATLLHRPAFRVPVVDTTGAGDIFHAGFLFAMLQGWPLVRQLDFACAAAALNCTAAGARGSIRPVAEIEAFLASAEPYELEPIPA